MHRATEVKICRSPLRFDASNLYCESNQYVLFIGGYGSGGYGSSGENFLFISIFNCM